MTKKVKNMTVVLATGWDENNNCPWELKGSVFKANIIRKRIKHYRTIYKTSTVKSKANNTGDWYWFNAFDFYTNWINETFSKEYENDSFWRLMDENTWKELKKYSHNVFLKEKESGKSIKDIMLEYNKKWLNSNEDIRYMMVAREAVLAKIHMAKHGDYIMGFVF
jgi:hypothetical protein